jgi:predicted RNA-binding Zn ribbon-like protein
MVISISRKCDGPRKGKQGVTRLDEAEMSPEPFFVGDNKALDFLNSIAAPHGDEVDCIEDWKGLTSWLLLVGLVTSDMLARADRTTATKTKKAIVSEARDLRDWFRQFISEHAGRPLEESALVELKRLNRLLARDRTFHQIVGAPVPNETLGEPALQMQLNRPFEAADELLFPIAQAMAELICRPDFERVKHCEGPTCTLWFIDTSKNHKRRWCSMEICGNRAKAAAHRERVKNLKK